jgi:Zn-dependent protease
LDLSWFIGLAVFVALSHDVWAPRVTGLGAVALSAAFTCAFFASVVAHELAHALVARALGVDTLEISLLLFGGMARIVSEPVDAGGEVLMAMAGPLTSVALAGLLWLVSHLLAGWAGDLVALLGLANLVLAVFNLLPGFPLDGGRVARAVVWRVTGRRLLATRVTAWIGRSLAGLLMAGGAVAVVVMHTPRYLLHVALGGFLWYAASQGERAARGAEQGSRPDDVATPAGQ